MSTSKSDMSTSKLIPQFRSKSKSKFYSIFSKLIPGMLKKNTDSTNCIECTSCFNCITSFNCDQCTQCNICDYCNDCILCTKCTNCTNCFNCNDCASCFNCIDCDYCINCVLCTGLNNKKEGYWFLNKKVSQEEFLSIVNNYIIAEKLSFNS